MVGIRSPDGLVVGVLPTDAEAQGPAARAPRSRLQLGLHAHACSSHCTLSVQQACCTSRDPLRDEIRKVGRGLSLIDTQTGRYGRIYSRRRLCARCSADAESSFDLVELVRLRCSKNSSRTQLSLQLSPWYRYRYRCVCLLLCLLKQMPVAGAYSREHCPRVYAICRPELG